MELVTTIIYIYIPATSTVQTATVIATTTDENGVSYVVLGVTDGTGDAASVQSLYISTTTIDRFAHMLVTYIFG